MPNIMERKDDASYKFADDPHYAATVVAMYRSEDPVVKKQAATIFYEEMGAFIRKKICEFFPTYGQYWDEMFNEAFCFCLEGLSDYDPTKGMPSTYFSFRVRKGGETFKEKNLDVIRRNDKANSQTIQKATKRLEERGAIVNTESILRETDGKITHEVLQRNTEVMQNLNLVYLDEPNESGEPVLDKYASSIESPESAVIKADERRILIREFKKRLTKTEAQVIIMNVIDKVPLKKVAKCLGLSDRETMGAKSMGLTKLRNAPEVKAIWGYNNDTAKRIRERNLKLITISFVDDDPVVDLSLVI